MSGADRDAFAAGGAAAAEHGSASLGLHALPKSVFLHAAAPVGLKCTLGHMYPLLFPSENLSFSNKEKYIESEERNPACGRRAIIRQTDLERWGIPEKRD